MIATKYEQIEHIRFDLLRIWYALATEICRKVADTVVKNNGEENGMNREKELIFFFATDESFENCWKNSSSNHRLFVSMTNSRSICFLIPSTISRWNHNAHDDVEWRDVADQRRCAQIHGISIAENILANILISHKSCLRSASACKSYSCSGSLGLQYFHNRHERCKRVRKNFSTSWE